MRSLDLIAFLLTLGLIACAVLPIVLPVLKEYFPPED